MDETERYIRDVLRNIPFPLKGRDRIEEDLRAHLEAAQAAGGSPAEAIGRMGAPAEVAEDLLSQVPLRYAGFWRRLGAFALDLCLIVVLAGVPAIVAMGLSDLVPAHPVGWGQVLGALILLGVFVCTAASVGVVVLYFPILEGRFGRTPGKRLLGLWVLKETRLPIGYKEAFLRRLSFYFDILAMDALFIPFTPRRQRAFDVVARTVVIQE